MQTDESAANSKQRGKNNKLVRVQSFPIIASNDAHRASSRSTNEMEDSHLWKESYHQGCKDALLSVKTPEGETKENCQPSPDSSHSPQQTVVDHNSSTELYHGDIKGMFICC